MQICDIMTDKVISVAAREPVTAAARLLRQYNLGALPVCDDNGKLLGMVTDRDIAVRCVAAQADPAGTTVDQIMSRGIITASPGDSLDRAVYLMSTDQVRRLPVLEDGRLVGLVSLCDLARDRRCDMEAAEALTEISTNVRRR
jgi:CBS domain-containing protein